MNTADQHVYSVILHDGDPLHGQPEKVLVPLKPHQRAGLQKAKAMEQHEYVPYHVPNPREHIPYANHQSPHIFGHFHMKTNIGIIGDIVGYGKTLLALSIIADLPREKIDIPKYRRHAYHHTSGYLEITKENNQRDFQDQLIKTTLVVVPRGPVYIQWKNSIQTDTRLKCLALENLPYMKKNLPATVAELRAHLEQYDLVLVKNTSLLTLLRHYREKDPHHDIFGFERIMIDEAHTIGHRIPNFGYNFLWFITSSYRELFLYDHARSIFQNLYHTVQHNIERLHYLLVKGDNHFVKDSFQIPAPVEHYYVCKMQRALTAIQPFLTQSVRDMINVNDISGAIRELGGTAETEDALVEIVVKDTLKEIANKEKEIAFFASLDLDPEIREQRVRSLQNELQRLQTRRESMEQRIKEVNTKTCSICYDQLENPIYLSCSHIYCGSCLFSWMQSNLRTRHSTAHCPECRTTIDSSKIVAIVKHKAQQEANVPMILSKEDQMLDIILKKPEGRFLLFSRMDTTFGRLSKTLEENGIPHCEIKGSTTHMMNILEDFRQNKIRVILLNTYHAGCGIDISCATDVIIYHSMPTEKIQAVGRAQRVGRTNILTIHNLCYPHEMTNEA